VYSVVAWIRDFYKQSIVYISYQCNIIKSIRKMGSESFLCNAVFTSKILSSIRILTYSNTHRVVCW